MFLKSIALLLSNKYTSNLQRDSIDELILREFPEELIYNLRTEFQEIIKQIKAKMEVDQARFDKLIDRQKSEKITWKEAVAQIKELIALFRSNFEFKQKLAAFKKRSDAEFKIVNARLLNEVVPREAYYKLCQLPINWDHWVRLQIIPLVSACKLITGVNPEPAEHTIDESDMGRYSKTRPAWVNLYDQAVSAEKAQLLAVTREHEEHKGEVSLHEFVNFIHRNNQSDAKYPWTVPGELCHLIVPHLSNRNSSEESNQKCDVPAEPDVSSSRVVDKLYRIIGALALMHAEKAKKYQKGERPNVNAIALSVEEIIDTLPDSNKYGLGNSNLREAITKGIGLLNE